MPVPNVEIDARMQHFIEVCRKRGLKATHQRMEVFRELAANEGHPDAETVFESVHKRIPAISLDTVYRTLAMLEENGLVRRVAVAGKARYDAETRQHHHFVCSECGVVYDFYSDVLDAVSVPQSADELGHIESCHIQVRGICNDCYRSKG